VVGHGEVHDRERLARDLGKALGFGDEPREHARAALGRLVQKEAAALLARGHPLREDLAPFELEDRLDAAEERVLQRRQRGLRQPLPGGL
jgi:hypothetical protein